MLEPGQPLVEGTYEVELGTGDVLVEVAGCGICHTDLGFLHDGVPVRHALPLVLGHEIAGRVVEAGDGANDWIGAPVVVPAVLPCGDCEACRANQGSICPRQIFPGNDLHGGFASHVKVPSRGLCRVPDLSDLNVNPAGLSLKTLSVIADAVSTPYQALLRSGLGPGDLALFIGVGGVGGFGVQIAHALGAKVIALDISKERLAQIKDHGASLTLNVRELDFKELRNEVRSFAKLNGIPTFRHRIFECSGTPAGQGTAFGLLGHGGYLGIVGFTPKKVELKLSNLMAFHATAQGNWGCLPEHYPAVLQLVLAGKISLAPFVENRPMSAINAALDEVHAGGTTRRLILTPDFGA